MQPTIFDRLPRQSVLFRDEFFAPILAVKEINSLDEAIQLSNDTVYGLTAGIFTKDDKSAMSSSMRSRLGFFIAIGAAARRLALGLACNRSVVGKVPDPVAKARLGLITFRNFCASKVKP